MSGINFVNVDVVLDYDKGALVPAYETTGAAGFDLRYVGDEPVKLAPGEHCLLSTGLKMHIPVGFELQIRPRSGVSWKNKVTVLNSPGTIDSDYRGEIKVMVINHSNDQFTINPGDRPAQGVVCPVFQAIFNVVDCLDDTDRGEGGFGSTGVN